MAFDRARLEASRAHLSQARKYLEMDEPDMLAWAASELERALGYDPTNRYAQDELDDVSFREALDILMQTNGLFYKFVGSSILMVTSRK